MANNNLLQPTQVESLVGNGMLSQNTANLLGPSTEENQLETQQAIEENQAINPYQAPIAPSAEQPIIPTPGSNSFRQIPSASNLPEDYLLQASDDLKSASEELDPAVKTAEDLIKADQEIQQKSQEIKDSIDIKEQKDQQKEIIKSKIAQEDALQEVAQEEQQKEQERLDSIQAEIQKEQDELKSMTLSNMFDDENAPISRVQAGIAIMLGALGSGLAGGPNLGLQAVNKTMDDYFNRKQEFGKDRIAKKQRIFDLIKLQLDKEANKTDDELKKARIRQINASIAGEQQALAQQRMQLAQQQMLQQRVSSGQKLGQEEEAALIASLSPEDRKRYIPGFGFAKDPEIAKKVSSQIDFGEQALSQTKKIRDLMSEYGNVEILDRGAVAAEESARKNLQLQLKELFNLGVLNGPDLDLLNEFTGKDFFSPTTTPANKQAKISAVEEYVKNRVNSALKTAGLPAMGKSKFDSFIEYSKSKGLSEREAIESYRRLKESGKIE